MKKVFTVLFVAAVMVAMPVQAQVKFGVKGGLNVSSMKFNESAFKSSNQAGWFIGPTVQLSLPLAGVGADISAFYDQKNLGVDDDETIKQQSILVPVNLRWKFGLSSLVGVYLAAGPQFGFNVGGGNFSLTNVGDYSETFQLKKSNLSINLGAGAYVTKHVEVGFAYNIPLGNTGDVTVFSGAKEAFNFKTNTWQISAAYFF